MRGEEVGATSQSSAQEVGEPSEIKISEELMAMTETELNRRIARAQEELRLQKKHSYLDVIDQGEQPDINPFELDTTVTESELGSLPCCRHSKHSTKIHLRECGFPLV
jgi:hypothetical protein